MSKVSIFMFIDALGWEVLKGRKFLEELFPYRNKVEMQFGYSCTAIPTILTGQPPTAHKHLSFYYYDPKKSPFKMFKYIKLNYLPDKIFSNWRIRHILSKIIAKRFGYTGYFELYAMPYDKLPYFDYIEKDDIFVPRGLAPVDNIADVLVKRKIKYHISNWRLSEEENINALLNDIKSKKINFAFLYTAAMDSLLHMVTKSGKDVDVKLAWYEENIKKIIEAAKNNYDEYEMFIFSDHGMTTLTETVNVKQIIEKLPLKFGKDYVATYDSTLARFWFLNNKSRELIISALSKVPLSHVLTEEEKIRYKINFPDNMYGETILLMDPGVQIVPSDMGIKYLPGMHGFAPEHEDSDASFLSTRRVENEPGWVGDYFKIMLEELETI